MPTKVSEPSGLFSYVSNQTLRRQCPECGGPIEWTSLDQARQEDAAIVEALDHFAAECLDVWHCLNEECDEWGFLERQWHTV